MNEVKEQCDGNCQTCPMQNRIFCTLMFSKEIRESVNQIKEQVQAMQVKFNQEHDGVALMPNNEQEIPNPQVSEN